MEGMRSGRVWLVCASLFCTLHVCLASVSVKVSPTVDVIIGETARLPCTFTTTGNMPVVQWFIEAAGTRTRVAFRSPSDKGLDKGTPLAERVTMDTDMTLVISPVKAIDERNFFCQVVDGPVGTSEAETKLQVFFAPEKPMVSENKQAIALNSGQHQVGKCTSNNGHPEPRIIWFKDSKPLPEVLDPKEKIYMVPGVVRESSGLFTVSSSLYIDPEKKDAKSVFYCTVEYRMPNGEIRKENSEPFNLTLLYPAENVFFTLLNKSPIKEGDEVQMKCETDGNPQPQFEFAKDDTPKETSETGLFVLKSITRSDSGVYKCEAMDFDAENIELIKTLTINVHYVDPVSMVPSSPLVVNKGDRFELQCKTKASDEYTLSWMKDGKQLLSQKSGYTVESATLDSAGEYVCVASVPSVPGLQKKANITVTVSGQPEIDVPMEGHVAKQGDMVTLRCAARGHPAPQFTWKPSGKESLEFHENTVTSTVTLEATATILKDGVICEATNMHGADSKKFTVEIKSDNTIDSGNGALAESQQGGSKGVVVAVLVCVLLLLLLVAVLFFFGKRGKMACRKDNNKDTESGDTKSGEKANEGSGLLKEKSVEP
ncbi:basal cell adhesion molecule isoform X2 [Silurus meridionalis]|uniref:basal cell adhesion molecule isoform X2 n=1 Tax=Silurus meridionalis TaxID=175797 RepID=UPI001EEC4E2F|nr:basal cell adhesion molecule isoform X2 [Silurus meridionalis]